MSDQNEFNEFVSNDVRPYLKGDKDNVYIVFPRAFFQTKTHPSTTGKSELYAYQQIRNAMISDVGEVTFGINIYKVHGKTAI